MNNKLKVLFVTSEAVPFAKTGGLADVAGSLPKALKKLGVDIRVVLPKYKHISQKYNSRLKSIGNGDVEFLHSKESFEVFYMEESGVTFYFIEYNNYYDRDGYYGYPDDGARFTFFCKAAYEMLPIVGFKPDIIHSNDWQTGAMPLLHKAYFSYRAFYKNIKSVFTIHNMKYQGVFPKEIMNSLLNISWSHFTHDKVEYHDQVNYLKSAIVYSDAITTVSPSYSKEIQHDFFAETLGGTIRSRSENIYGILNGIDYDEYNPEQDDKIFATFSTNDLDGKYVNKKMLQESLNLPVKPGTPVIGMITRLVDHKGIDLVETMFDEILQMDVQMVILGAGEYRYEEMIKHFATKYPHKLSCHVMYNAVLAQRIYAGCDMFLMPSLFEPCGLSQIISLRYGTIPIVRETGGLKDTVIPYNQYTDQGLGFTFTNYNAHEMLDAVKRALDTYHHREVWRRMILRGMNQDNSWQHSAKEYKKLYNNLMI